MDLPIRFFSTPSGARIAYATIGEGPPLVWCPKWISHLERLWAHSAFRSFMRTTHDRLRGASSATCDPHQGSVSR